MQRRHFGTDGIRGRVGEAPITADFMLKLGWAAGKVLAAEGGRKVLIGKDTRISGYMFESALEAGLSAAGVDIALLGPMPTPAIAYLTRTFHAAAGIVISASHNPFDDNGIKFFSGQGTKLADAVELQIEAMLDQPMHTVAPARLGKAQRVADAGGRYIEFCKGTIPAATSLRGLRIVCDCANGATYHVAPAVLAELGADVIPLAVSPDGLNINAGCGSTAPAALQAAVCAHEADLGVAFDGDGDRLIMVDRRGAVVDGDEILYILAADRLQRGEDVPAVVGTLMSNLGLELALRDLGIGLHRARVGDRYVMELLQREALRLGGEGSGHIICLDRNTTGDGIVAALQVLAAMQRTGRGLDELRAGMSKHPQVMINVPVARGSDPGTSPEVGAAVAEAEARLAGRGRVLLRPSGTEPVLRVMVEGIDEALVRELASGIADIVAARVGRVA